MKILFVLEYYYPHIGGVETLFKSLTEELVSRGFEVTVVTNKYNNTLPSKETINGVNIKRYHLINRYIFTFLSVFPIISEARQHDIIHTTSYNAGLPSFLAAKITRTKVVITFHEVWRELWYSLPFMSWISRKMFYYFEALLLKLPFDKFIAVSDFTKDALQNCGIPSYKISRIYNGIDYEDFESLDKQHVENDHFRYCYFGRLGVSKGIDLLLPAIQLCKQVGVKFRFILIIPSEVRGLNQYVQQQLLDLQIRDVVDIQQDLDRQTLLELIRSCDAIVIPSYSEGFGFTAVESMALDIPIISSANGALSEVVSGKHINMETFDSQSLAKAMQDAYSGKWTVTPKKRFTLAESVDEYCKMYKTMDLKSNNYS